MIENLFEIATYNKPIGSGSVQQKQSGYHSLVKNFCYNSYGLYTQFFIKKLSTDAQNIRNSLIRLNLKKYIRKCVKKFMMTDLELVFVAYYCNRDSWLIQNIVAILKEDSQEQEQEIQEQSFYEKCLETYLDLNAYFVKSYVGNIQQFQAIDSYLSQIFPQFIQIYQKWIKIKLQRRQKQKNDQNSEHYEAFIITPRKINQIYRQYSKSTQQTNINSKKDYNDLVETLIQLSTTYSIIPNKKNEKDKIGKQKNQNRKQSSLRKNQKATQQIFNSSGKSKRQYKQEKQRYRKRSQIFKIVQNSEINQQSSVPRYGFDYLNSNISNSNRPKRKSSLLFESLQSLSKKSEQLVAQNRFKQQQNLQKSNRIQKQAQQQQLVERSRQKKQVNKISLNKKKQSKPNETVLGFLKQPSMLQMDHLGNQGSGQKSRKLEGDQRGRGNNLSILNSSNGNFKEHNFSFINLRSNRSSRSNSQLPFLWKPGDEDNFFQKSRLN